MFACWWYRFGQWLKVTVTNDITTNTTWSAANEYLLDGLILSILALCQSSRERLSKPNSNPSITTGDGASALIVRRGAKINAQGTPDSPIIFTQRTGPVERQPQRHRPWIVGRWIRRGTTNQPTTENQIEVFPVARRQIWRHKWRGWFGNFHFVSIRHGGFSISGVPGDEINGLTMGAVGSQTIIHHIEVLPILTTDIVVWRHGVNTKYLDLRILRGRRVWLRSGFPRQTSVLVCSAGTGRSWSRWRAWRRRRWRNRNTVGNPDDQQRYLLGAGKMQHRLATATSRHLFPWQCRR